MQEIGSYGVVERCIQGFCGKMWGKETIRIHWAGRDRQEIEWKVTVWIDLAQDRQYGGLLQTW
jgi:hypothetical protein